MRDLQVIGVLLAGTLVLALWQSPESTATPARQPQVQGPAEPAANEVQLLERGARGDMILNANAIR